MIFASLSCFYLSMALVNTAFAAMLLWLSGGGGTKVLLWVVLVVVWAFASTLAIITWMDICEQRVDVRYEYILADEHRCLDTFREWHVYSFCRRRPRPCALACCEEELYSPEGEAGGCRFDESHWLRCNYLCYEVCPVPIFLCRGTDSRGIMQLDICLGMNS